MNLNSHHREETPPVPSIGDDLLSFLQWWDTARADTPIPARSALQIEKIAPLISRLTVIDVFSADRMIFRLTGTAIDAQAGLSPKGMNVLDITRAEYRELRSHRLWQMATCPCIGLFHYTGQPGWPEGQAASGISVPASSSREGSDVQFLTLFESYRPSIDREEPGSPITQVMPNRFFYVDVGAGTPDDGTGERVTLDEIYGWSSRTV